MISAKVEGLAAVKAALDKAARKVKQKATRKAANAGSRIVLWAMKAAVRNVTGLLRKSLGRKVKAYRDTGVAVGIVGPRTKQFKVLLRTARKGKNAGKPVYANPTQYAHLVDRGTSRSRAFPFREPVQQATREQVKAAMAEAVRSVVEGQGE